MGQLEMTHSFTSKMDDKVVVALAVYAMQKLNDQKGKRRKREACVKPYLADPRSKSNFQIVHDLRTRLHAVSSRIGLD